MVTPRSSQERVTVVDGEVRVWVKAPPVEGRANQRVEQVMAEALGVRSGDVSVVGGHTSRRKLVSVTGMELDEAYRRLGAARG